MGDHQQRKARIPRGDRGDRTVDLPFGAAVERRGRLVEEKHVGAAVEGACDADALPLSAREAAAAFADGGVDPQGQRSDEFAQLGRFEGFGDPPAVDFGGRDARCDVGRKCSVGEEQTLRDIADAVLPCPAVCGGEGRAVDGDFSRQIGRASCRERV